MAIYNEILAGRFNRMLQKFLSMKGGPPAPQLASDIQPSLALFSGVENRYLEQWYRYGVQTAQPATVGQQSAIRLRNPVNSNVIVVLEKITWSNTNGATQQNVNLQIGPIAVDYGTIVSPALQNLDARQGVGTSSVMIISRSGAGATVNVGFTCMTQSFAATNNSADLILYDDQQLTILPGWAVQQITSNVNEQLTSAWIWRERSLEESERS